MRFEIENGSRSVLPEPIRFFTFLAPKSRVYGVMA